MNIHWIWMGDPMPEHYEKFISDCVQMNPGCTPHLWGEEEIFDADWIQNRDVIEQMRRESKQEGADLKAYWTHVADVVDYELMLKYGGWYFNVDMKHLQPLTVLNDSYDMSKPGLAMEDDFWPVNMAMYSPGPDNDFYAHVVEDLGPRYFNNPGAFMNYTTGAHLLKSVVDQGFDLNLFPRNTFNPLHWSQFDYGDEPDYDNVEYPPETIATHLWQHRTTQRGQRILES